MQGRFFNHISTMQELVRIKNFNSRFEAEIQKKILEVNLHQKILKKLDEEWNRGVSKLPFLLVRFLPPQSCFNGSIMPLQFTHLHHQQ